MRKPTRASGSRRTRTIRSTAALLGALLAFGSLAPPLALAKHEHDTEGEGTSAPGALPGLEIGVGQDPAGEETTLSEESLGPEESEAEEEVPAPEVEEAVPPVGVEGTPPPPAVEPPPPSPEPKAVVPVEEAPAPGTEPAPPPPAEAPSYGPEASPPTYETEPSTPSATGEAVVQNETITGPIPSAPKQAKEGRNAHNSDSHGVVAEPEPAPEVPVTPEPAPSSPALLPAAPVDRAGSIAGKKSHLVAAGECLWTIAESYLPPGASNTEIATEVHRLWRLNAERIGTGDPDALPIGVKLRLG
jgi:hypothetical protein